MRSVDCDYYTDAIDYTKVTILDCFASDEAAIAHHGEVHVVSRVVGFKKIKFYTNENVGSGELDLPEQQMHTTAYWLEVPAHDPVDAAVRRGRSARRRFVGLAFAMKNVAQLLLMCDQRDIGLSVNAGDEVTPDAVAGPGRAADLHLRHLSRRHRLQRAALRHARRAAGAARAPSSQGCDCENGCPTCVGPIGETGPLAKTVALRLLQHLVGPALPADGGEALAEGERPASSALTRSPAPQDDVPF